jgi:hypothetical protein
MRRFIGVGMTGLAILACQVGTTASARVARDDATGTWAKSEVLRDGKTVTWTYKLKQDGKKLTGTFIRADRTTEIEDGSVVDGKVSFKTVSMVAGKVYKVQYTGDLQGDMIKGQTEAQVNDGQKRTSIWEVKRSTDK